MVFVSPETSLASGVGGGVLIALSSTGLMFFTGNVLGISGILGSTISKKESFRSWRVPFLVGMLGAGIVATVVAPGSAEVFFASKHGSLKPAAAALAGVLVGFGTRMANGCTSGHGVCGLPRFSPRSLVAVGSFMASGAVTAYFTRALPALRALIEAPAPEHSVRQLGKGAGLATLAAALTLGVLAFRKSWDASHQKGVVAAADETFSAKVAALVAGAMFGTGLLISGMTSTDRVHGFLDFTSPDGWDMTLAGVMGGAVAVNLLTFNWMSTLAHPPVLSQTSARDLHQQRKSSDAAGPDVNDSNNTDNHAKVAAVPEVKPLSKTMTFGARGANLKIDARLVIGSIIFGMGWGLAGMCPGPALVAAAAGVPLALVVVPSLAAGMAVHDLVVPTA